MTCKSLKLYCVSCSLRNFVSFGYTSMTNISLVSSTMFFLFWTFLDGHTAYCSSDSSDIYDVIYEIHKFHAQQSSYLETNEAIYRISSSTCCQGTNCPFLRCNVSFVNTVLVLFFGPRGREGREQAWTRLHCSCYHYWIITNLSFGRFIYIHNPVKENRCCALT